VGIHTHGDGVIHIHPFSEAAAGESATLGLFLRENGVVVDDGQLRVGDEQHADGEECDGTPARVRIAYWADADAAAGGAEPDRVVTDPDDLRFRHDGEAYTVVFAPESATIEPPPSVDQLAELGAADSSSGGKASGGTGSGATTSELPPPPDPSSDAPGYTDPRLAEEVLGRTPPDPEPPPADTRADALDVETLIEGEGTPAALGDTVTVHYVGLLADGTVIDSSWERGEPFPVRLGGGEVIAGWDSGLVGAQIGERRRLVIGSENAYGATGRDPVPPDAPLAFEIDVVDVSP
jgi:hypothetical protein